ncbi:MAG: DNA recombination protein RmuC, partial [Pseudomonadota bacterium]
RVMLASLSAQPDLWLWLIIALALGIAFGILLEWIFSQPSLREKDLRIATLEAKQTGRDELEEERNTLMALVTSQLTGTFGELAHKTMRDNSESFLKLAEQHLANKQQQADGQLEAREKAIESLVKPIEQALKRSEQQINELEKARHLAYGGITEQLTNVQQLTQGLAQETRNLTTALRRPEVRGQWGELTLKRLVEMAGMVEHCDFVEQGTIRDDEGAMLRPDLIIRMPDRRELVVDVKTPLDAYLSAVEAADDQQRDAFLVQHARKVQERIKELASKAYWSQFENSPEFVILFIPGDQFLSAALKLRPQLIDDALRDNIILATPTSFIALLKAIAYGWNQLVLQDNARDIQQHAVDLYGRLVTFNEHVETIGKRLDASVKAYNKAVGSLEQRVLPSARRFNELGVQAKKPLPEMQPIETSARATSFEPDDSTE